MSDIEREEFEQAVADKWSDSYKFTRFGDEDYYDEVLEGIWQGWQASRQALEGEAIGEVGYMFQPNWDDPSKTKGVALFDKSLAPGTKLYTHPASADNQAHWSQGSPGLADQYRQEAFAAREALGFSCDSLEVSPADIRQAIADKQAVSVPEWIKCSDKMPKINSPVVVARISDNDGKPCLDSGVAALQPNNGWIGLGVFYRPKIDAGTIYQNDFSVMDVTHWMPLPKPPKQEKSQ
jgi:hypothetical protein